MAGDQGSFGGMVVRFVRTNILTLLNIAGVIGGVVVAVVLRASRDEPWSAREVMYVGFVGQFTPPSSSHLFHLFQLFHLFNLINAR